MFCPACGKQMPDDAKFSTGCGMKMDAPAVPSAPAPVQQFTPSHPAPPPPPAAAPQYSPEQKEYYQQQQAAFEQQRQQQPGGQQYPPPPQYTAQQQMGGFDFGRALTYLFQDKDWIRNVLVAGLCVFIPFLGGFSLIGYCADITKRVAAGQDLPLPRYSFGGYLGSGFKFFCYMLVAGLVMLPVTLIIYLPLFFLGTKTPAMMILVQIVNIGLNILYLVYFSAVAPFFFVEENLAVCINFRKIFSFIKNNLTLVIMAVVCYFVSGIVSMIGLLGLIIGVVFTVVISMMINAHVYGQIYAKSVK